MRRFFSMLAVVALASFFFLPSFALAASVDLRPTAITGINLAGTVIGLVATAILGVFTHGSIETNLRHALQSAIEAAVGFAVMKVNTSNWGAIEVKNSVVAIAIEYVQKYVPNALKWFKVTPEKLAEMILARLSLHVPIDPNYIEVPK